MAAAAVTSLACPLRRSSRLTSRRSKSQLEDENELLTPRALRALKRRRQPIHIPKKRRSSHKHRLSDLPSPSSPEPLSPLTPSPEPSQSLPGHDRLPSPPLDPLPDQLPPPPPPPPLDPALDSLIPFDGQFTHDLAVHLPPVCPPPPQQHLPSLDLQDQFHSFPQPQLYPSPPLFVRDREINIWKLACQERVDCLLRRYGIDYIKALVKSEARSRSPPSSSPPASHTQFRLYTPASYIYSSTSWGSSSRPCRPFPLDDEPDDHEVPWPIDDPDWPDADVDMDDEDEDDYEDEDDAADMEAVREGEATLEAVQAFGDVSNHISSKQPSSSLDVPPPQVDAIHVDECRSPTKTPSASEPPDLSSPPPTSDTPPRPLTPVPHLYPPPPTLTPPSLPPLSSLHVPLLSEPPRAFMGRGTPPDRRRLIEWSGSGRFAATGMGPPLYLSPVPQRHPADIGMVPMSINPPVHSSSQSPHSNGEWTSFLFSMLEGDGVGVGTNVANTSHTSEPPWYELGLGSVPASGLELPISPPHPHARTPAVEQPVEETNNSSSTLRFALG